MVAPRVTRVRRARPRREAVCEFAGTKRIVQVPIFMMRQPAVKTFGRWMICAALVSLNAWALGEPPALLTEALSKVAQDQSRWAYTETAVQKDEKGKVKRATVVRVDPSKPYVEQFTLVEYNGKPPTERQQKEYRRRGERLAEAAERRERGIVEEPKGRRPSVGEIVDLNRAVVTVEDAQAITYEVPLKEANNQRFPPEKFQVVARVNKESRAIENVFVRLREPMRAKLVLKVKSGDASVEFTTIDPKYPPVMSSIRGEASASILFVNVGGNLEVKRTDFKRVKPYADRFGVQIGPTEALDF
jgi:hypothetical protein